MEDTGYEFFARYYDALTENVNAAARAEYFHGLIQKYQQSDGNVLLDLACGTGTISEEMVRRGYDVIGVDISYGMLTRATEKKLEKNLPIRYLHQDMRHLNLGGSVDATLCVLDSLNHLPDFSAVKTVFSRVYRHTKPGGIFVFDMNTCHKHHVLLGNQCYPYETDDVYCVWENALRADGVTVDITLNFFVCESDGRYCRVEETLTERAYEAEDIAAAVKESGFTLLGLYEADTELPLTPKSERLVCVARREIE